MRIAVLASGSGTNFEAIAQQIKVELLVCNVPGAKCLERAQRLGVRAEVLDHKQFATRANFDAALIELLQKNGIELVVLAGFMRLLTPQFIQAFHQKVVNVHPALLPAFPGAHGIRDALAYGVKVTGVTVHFVDEGTDTGAVIAQAAVPVLEGDDEKTLAERIHAEEHRIFPEAIRAVAEGRVSIHGRRVEVRR
jgi:phosphoribosylglycinamide formyltransferase 1